MENILSIVIGILIFGLIIFIHELGHFITAKLSGVRVNEFALGMGPKLLHFKKGETVYALRALPVGGFCAMEGEDSESADERAFCKKPVSKRILIVVAGALMNMLLGLVLIIIMHSTDEALTTTQISWFEEGASSEQSGLMVGDEIIRVNGMRIFTDIDVSYQFSSDSDGVFDMVVLRDGKKVTLNDVAFVVTDGNLHIDFKVMPEKVTPLSVAKMSFKTFASYARLIWISLGDLVTGQYGLNDLSGPVGIVDTLGQVVQGEREEDGGIDWDALMDKLLYLAAFMTINVGVFNLLPLPALDGGRLIFLVVEAVRRKPVKPEHEGMVHFVGLAILMLLMLVITSNDIMRIIKR